MIPVTLLESRETAERKPLLSTPRIWFWLSSYGTLGMGPEGHVLDSLRAPGTGRDQESLCLLMGTQCALPTVWEQKHICSPGWKDTRQMSPPTPWATQTQFPWAQVQLGSHGLESWGPECNSRLPGRGCIWRGLSLGTHSANKTPGC
jgi:hypothetical protein